MKILLPFCDLSCMKDVQGKKHVIYLAEDRALWIVDFSAIFREEEDDEWDTERTERYFEEEAKKESFMGISLKTIVNPPGLWKVQLNLVDGESWSVYFKTKKAAEGFRQHVCHWLFGSVLKIEKDETGSNEG